MSPSLMAVRAWAIWERDRRVAIGFTVVGVVETVSAILVGIMYLKSIKSQSSLCEYYGVFGNTATVETVYPLPIDVCRHVAILDNVCAEMLMIRSCIVSSGNNVIAIDFVEIILTETSA